MLNRPLASAISDTTDRADSATVAAPADDPRQASPYHRARASYDINTCRWQTFAQGDIVKNIISHGPASERVFAEGHHSPRGGPCGDGCQKNGEEHSPIGLSYVQRLFGQKNGLVTIHLASSR